MLKLFKRCLKAIYENTARSGNYAIEVEGDTLYLLFQWSKGFWDWVHNFLFPAKPYKRMKCIWFCHRGFRKVWRAMRDEVEARVKEILANNPNIKEIKCIGYSHGGALSVFATEDMEYLYGKFYKVSGYGFGAPRVLWGKVPREVKYRLRNFTLVRNIGDIVTHVPPMLFGFRNVGTLVKVGKNGKYGPFKAHRSSSYIAELKTKGR